MGESGLIELGLVAKGDRLKLEAFCKASAMSTDREEKISKIKEILEQGKKGKKRDAPQTSGDAGTCKKASQSTGCGATKKKSAKSATLKFEFGWKHWRVGRGFVQQKKNVGSGTRTFQVPREATLDDCQTIAQNLFFPNGCCADGNLEEMITAMADFSSNLVALMKEGENPFRFTAERYKQRTGLPVPRLYLLTKLACEDESSDSESLPPVFDEGTKSSPFPVSENDGLIGTTAERQKFFYDLEEELRTSLEADRAKEKREEERRLAFQSESECLIAKEFKEDRLERLRWVRDLRCPPEPNSDDYHVRVSVRHTSLGVVTRAFDPDGSIQGIYDWVGSLCRVPEHFRLIRFPSTTLYPDQKIECVKNTILNMTVETDPVPFSIDEVEVQFQDGQGFDEPLEETLRDERDESVVDEESSVAQVQIDSFSAEIQADAIPPVHLLSDEGNLKSDLNQRLEEKRINYLRSNVLPTKIVIVDRHDVVKELLALYSDEEIIRSRLSVSFLDETALGDGVIREMYSLFWDSFTSRYCEGNEQFALMANPSLSDADYVSIGRIITHQFVLTGTFPVQVAEAQVQHAMFGQATDECVVNSFLQLLPEREHKVLAKARIGDGPFPTNEVIDILSEFSVTSYPTPENLQQILKQVSTSELIHKPYFLLAKIKQGMGDFWKDVTEEEMHELYTRTFPTCTNVIACLEFSIDDKQEEKVSGWLIRFLKGADSKLLCRFLRFCTGANIVLPGNKIQVRFESMSELALRPKAKTCFRTLALPKGYNSFAHFSSNLELYLSNMSLWELRD